MAKAFSIEDGNLSNIPIFSSIAKKYKDIDLTFEKKPTGDVYKKEDAAAVKQAVKNLLLTNYYEKPFQPFYGGDLNRFLFDLSEGFDVLEIKEQILTAIDTYEPRAEVQAINADVSPDQNRVNITVVFRVINTTDTVQLDLSIARLR